MQKLFFIGIAPLIFLSSTCETVTSQEDSQIYRERMVSFVDLISDYAREHDSDFIVIPQNGIQLLAERAPDGGLTPNNKYLNAIDGIGRESVFYGYHADNEATPDDARAYINRYLQLAKNHGKAVMITDYARDPPKMDSSYAISDSLGYISFAANHRNLDVIPPYPTQPHEVNSGDIRQLNDAENFLYLINPQQYQEKSEFIADLDSTNYDMIIMDLFFHGDHPVTKEEVERLQTKANGGRRLVIAYMSIGEAEDYRYYWQRSWNIRPPHWLGKENPNWEGNYLVQYWESAWQDIIYGSKDSYLDRILAAGFDGVYLDLVDAYRNFEEREEEN